MSQNKSDKAKSGLLGGLFDDKFGINAEGTENVRSGGMTDQQIKNLALNDVNQHAGPENLESLTDKQASVYISAFQDAEAQILGRRTVDEEPEDAKAWGKRVDAYSKKQAEWRESNHGADDDSGDADKAPRAAMSSPSLDPFEDTDGSDTTAAGEDPFDDDPMAASDDFGLAGDDDDFDHDQGDDRNAVDDLFD